MDTFEKAQKCAQFADEKKGRDIVILELIGLTDIADYFVLASATSERHVRTIAEAVEVGMKGIGAVSYTHLRAHETPEHLVCRLLLEKKKKTNQTIMKTNKTY